jgi:hypothetical protein
VFCQKHSVAKSWNCFFASKSKACIFIVLKSEIVDFRTYAIIVSNEILAHTRSTSLTAAIINIATELFPLLERLLKAIATVARVSIDALSDCVDAISTWSTGMPLASIYISALHIWCWVAELTIGHTFHEEGGRGIELSTSSVPSITGVGGSFLEVQMLANFTIDLRMAQSRHFSTADRFTFLFVIVIKFSCG